MAQLTALLRSLENLWRSPIHFGFAVGLAVFGGATLWLRLGSFAAGLVVFLADAYLLLMLWSAASRSPTGEETLPRLPYKETAVVIFPSTLLALVFAFGALYLNTVGGFTSARAAAYFSFVNLATFTYDPIILNTSCAKAIAACQIASGVLLLICAVPLLVSRLADFGGGVKNLNYNGCEIFLPDSSGARVTITGGTFTWMGAEKTVKAIYDGRQVTVECTRTCPDATLLVISSDGQCHVGK